MNSNIYFFSDDYYMLVTWLCVAGVALLLLYVLRLRHYDLIKKYASWQNESQDVETATHDALQEKDARLEGNYDYPFISIIMPTNEHDGELKPQLDALLRQQYRGEFEVIIADEDNRTELRDYVDYLREEFSHLRYTFVPTSSRNIEKRKLALTLGIKAARGTWAIVINADCKPCDEEWLQHYAQNLTEDINFAQAYYNYEDDGSIVARRAILERMTNYARRLYAKERDTVLGCNQANWAVRKDWFFMQEGFVDSLQLAFGEEYLFATFHADTDSTAMLCSPTTSLRESLPARHTLDALRVEEAELMHRTKRRFRVINWLTNMASIAVYLNAIALVCYPIFRIVCNDEWMTLSMKYVTTDILYILLLVASIWLPIRQGRKGLKVLDEHMRGFYLFAYNLLRPWYTLSTTFRRWGHQRDFERKYL